MGHVFLQKEHDEFENETLLEMDWDANIVWQWGVAAPGGKAHQAWDQARLANSNTLVFSIADHEDSSRAAWKFADQAIYEVTSAGDGSDLPGARRRNHLCADRTAGPLSAGLRVRRLAGCC